MLLITNKDIHLPKNSHFSSTITLILSQTKLLDEIEKPFITKQKKYITMTLNFEYHIGLFSFHLGLVSFKHKWKINFATTHTHYM